MLEYYIHRPGTITYYSQILYVLLFGNLFYLSLSQLHLANGLLVASVVRSDVMVCDFDGMIIV